MKIIKVAKRESQYYVNYWVSKTLTKFSINRNIMGYGLNIVGLVAGYWVPKIGRLSLDLWGFDNWEEITCNLNLAEKKGIIKPYQRIELKNSRKIRY